MVFVGLSSVPVTKLMTGASVALGVMVMAELVGEEDIFFSSKRVFSDRELWRIATSLLYLGKFDITMLSRLIGFVQYSHTLEANVFTGRPEDYIVFLVFGTVFFTGLAGFVYVPFLSDCLISYLTYYWAKHFGDHKVQILSLPFQVDAMYMPLISIGLATLRGIIPVLQVLLGFAVAHLFFFLRDVIGVRYNLSLLRAPSWLTRATRPIHSRN